ncbi:MAG TPA: RNA methyltransferase, partial [Chitinophagaceae bacterium]|nr:RNA methyltransferase [Chitinophagaceae bacterium]
MLPVNFIQTIQHINGFDREGFEAVHTNSNPITSIRLNDEKVCNNLSYLYQQQVPWCNHAYYLKERPSFTLEPSFHAGAFYVQEASSMFLWHIIKQLYANNTEKKVLDVCAAPGGKSTLLASYFKNGLIVSNEIIKSRAAILVEN